MLGTIRATDSLIVISYITGTAFGAFCTVFNFRVVINSDVPAMSSDAENRRSACFDWHRILRTGIKYEIFLHISLSGLALFFKASVTILADFGPEFNPPFPWRSKHQTKNHSA